MENKEYKLGNDFIANMVQLLQLAMLSGTDISDHLKMMRLSPGLDPHSLELSPSYQRDHEERIKKMIGQIESLREKMAPKEIENEEQEVPPQQIGFFN